MIDFFSFIIFIFVALKICAVIAIF